MRFFTLLLLALVAAGPIEHGDARFTVITPNLVRIEISKDGKFIDDRSMFAIHRDASFDAKVTREGDSLAIDTSSNRLTPATGNLTGKMCGTG